MSDNQKLEQVLEHPPADEQDKAKELVPRFYGGKST